MDPAARLRSRAHRPRQGVCGEERDPLFGMSPLVRWNAEPSISPPVKGPAGANRPAVWRSLEELAQNGDSPEFRALLAREFPTEAAAWESGAIDRRSFLTL